MQIVAENLVARKSQQPFIRNRKADDPEKKKKLLDAACAEFAQHGYELASINRINIDLAAVSSAGASFVRPHLASTSRCARRASSSGLSRKAAHTPPKQSRPETRPLAQ